MIANAKKSTWLKTALAAEPARLPRVELETLRDVAQLVEAREVLADERRERRTVRARDRRGEGAGIRRRRPVAVHVPDYRPVAAASLRTRADAAATGSSPAACALSIARTTALPTTTPSARPDVRPRL